MLEETMSTLKDLSRQLKQLQKQIPFATAQAMTSVVVDTACSWVRIIYLTDHDIDVMDKQTKRDILAHNKSVQANCPQSTDRVTR